MLRLFHPPTRKTERTPRGDVQMPIDTIILDVQHMGKPKSPFSRGGKNDDGDYESDLALKYAICIRERFLVAGYKTFLMTHGSYQERHAWANRYCDPKTSLYLACHINSGGGRYPLVEYTVSAMPQTKKLAKLIANKFTEKLTPLETDPAYPYFDPAQAWELTPTSRGWVCIAQTIMSALILEPLFIDNPQHLEVAKKPFAVARAVFEAVEEFNSDQ